MKQLATLMPDGRISSSIGGQQMVFESPSAFRCSSLSVNMNGPRALLSYRGAQVAAACRWMGHVCCVWVPA